MKENLDTVKKDILSSPVDLKRGLSNEEVAFRCSKKLTNKSKVKVGKSYLQIIFTDLFSFFNILLFAIAGLMIYAGNYDGLFFLFVLLPNIGVTMYEDIHARYLLGKLSLVNQPTATVLRNGVEVELKSDDIVLGDIIILRGQSQICADAVVLKGTLSANESMLTGESLAVVKKEKDKVFAGSFTISGDAILQVTAVGKDCYIEKIHEQANKFKRTHSEIKHSLDSLFIVIGVLVVCVAALMVTIYAFQGKFSNEAAFKEAIKNSISGSMVAMIPCGMYLLTSAVFSLSVIRLSEKKAQIQDFYSVEMLSKINILCVDKTGTITDGQLKIKEIKPLNPTYSASYLARVLKTLVTSTGDNNVTAKSILKEFEKLECLNAKTSIPFSSDNKYSAVTLDTGETFVMGAYECINCIKSPAIEKEFNDCLEAGLRVLVVTHSFNSIKDNKLPPNMEVLALLILEDHVKDDAKETFEWFQKNNVEIRVISGDNAKSVSYIAHEAGIKNAERYVSLAGMSLENVRKIARNYTVFGRVTPEQKEVLVTTLKEDGKKVAMTGDGVNDILALKRSDCSIAMANGSDAAKNVANIVLLDSNFHSLPNVVAEGRKIVSNLQRTCSLFLSKTMFAIFFSLYFLFASLIAKDPSISYPFKTNHLYLWEIFGIGMASFFLALEQNESKFEGHFMKNILIRAIPAGIIVILAVCSILVCNQLQLSNIGYFGILDFDTVVSMCAITFSILGIVILYKVCEPLSKYRLFVLIGSIFFTFTLGGIALIVTNVQGTSDNSILRIPFEKMTPTAWFTALVVIIVSSALYLLVTYIIKVLKGEDSNAKN